jgi:hypothetical protein|tara:strand:+ start:1407 stop:1655 length:249 start_codon:yes stop_codon:yes gene_type:complete
MSKKIIKLKESDIENIVKRVLQEQEEEINIEQPGIEITLDQIAMLLSDGECECGGERLVLNLNGGNEVEDEDEDEDEVEVEY